MIDNMPENFKLQPLNGLWIKTWNEDMKDSQLLDLFKLLKDIYSLQPSDVKVVIKKIKDEVTKRLGKNSSNPYSNISL